jgi:hypothetical protein
MLLAKTDTKIVRSRSRSDGAGANVQPKCRLALKVGLFVNKQYNSENAFFFSKQSRCCHKRYTGKGRGLDIKSRDSRRAVDKEIIS